MKIVISCRPNCHKIWFAFVCVTNISVHSTLMPFLLYCLQATRDKSCVLMCVFARVCVCTFACVLVRVWRCEDLPFKSGCEGNLVHPDGTSHSQPPSKGPSPNPIHPLYYTNAMARNQHTPFRVDWSSPWHLCGVWAVPLRLLLRGGLLWFLM